MGNWLHHSGLAGCLSEQRDSSHGVSNALFNLPIPSLSTLVLPNLHNLFLFPLPIPFSISAFSLIWHYWVYVYRSLIVVWRPSVWAWTCGFTTSSTWRLSTQTMRPKCVLSLSELWTLVDWSSSECLFVLLVLHIIMFMCFYQAIFR